MVRNNYANDYQQAGASSVLNKAISLYICFTKSARTLRTNPIPNF